MTRMARVSRHIGYSIAEIIIVITILAVLMAIGIMNVSRARANRELDTAAVELTNALKYARQLAMSSNGATVTFTGGGTYAIATSGGQLLRQLAVPGSVAVTVPAQMNPLTFGANGSASNGGTITVTSAATGRTGSITVQQVAGTASVAIQ